MPERISFTIEIDGQPVSTAMQITSVVVNRQINRIPSAKVIIVDGETNINDFEVSNEETFIPGKELTVKAGNSGDEEQIFQGIITGHRLKVRSGGRSNLIVEARDAAFKMTLNPKSTLFEEVTDSDIIEEVLGNYSDLTPDVEATEATHLRMVQHQATDWDFVLARARANGKVLFVSDGELKIAAPTVNEAPAVTLTYGENVLELDLEIDSRYQATSLKTKAWAQADQEIVEAEAADPDSPDQGNIDAAALADAAGSQEVELYDSGQSDETALQAWADARLKWQRLARIRGSIRFSGDNVLLPGVTVELVGFGDRFNGDAFVSGIRHELYDGGWTSDIAIGLPENLFPDVRDSCCQTELLPAISGLHVGKVLQLQDDPDGAERILVHIPMIVPEGSGLWARWASVDAGNGRGFVWRPDIDDEVVVGFLGDDPRSPVVLGGLHSAANPAPIDASDDNFEKGYVSGSEMRFHFDDDKKIITIETPGGHQLLLDEDDSSIRIVELNGNSVTMNSDGITMDSPADFTVTCSGNATIEAGGNIELTASGDMTASAANVTVEASANATISGSASAELSSGGQTKLEGSVVMIN
ncbi:MAG: type VI secretion system tip protein VgrG [Desulfovibrionaceae bacterium]|nr:type VI secretion system tip protein VgrG [Desulfovibrionaceae bacterium]